MANNLRVLSVVSENNVLVKALFTDTLYPGIGVDNVEIISQTYGVPSPQVLKTKVNDKTLEIQTQPLTALASYIVVFKSTNETVFRSLNSTSVLFEDGVANKIFFLGPIETTNAVKEYFLNYLRDNVYNTEDGTVLSSYINVLSSVLSTALYDVRQLKNENYLSLTITDEKKIRGATAFDRLDQEGAYEIVRVGKAPTNTVSEFNITIDEFGDDPISLLKSDFSESLSVGSTDRAGNFNINSLILNLSKKFVIKLKSLIFTYSNGHLPYTYDTSKYGYQILDDNYDTSAAFKYLLLENNQIKLNDKILEDSEFSLDDIFQVQAVYEYKDTGKIIDSTSVAIDTVLSSGREVLPPLTNVFNLKHAPIVTSNNKIGTIGDIIFVDQNSLAALSTPHPAFATEIKFRLDFLPSNPGEYSVDYETGTVYVFGDDYINDGTGDAPPLAIYNYRLNFKENIDWVFDASLNDLVALPTGSLYEVGGDISFNYEKVLSNGIDYKPQIHQEVLDERIGNNLVALNTLNVENSPITNVFRVFNETSGEIYQVSRWNNNKIYFTYNTPPVLEEILNERISFQTVNNEVMFVSSVIDTLLSTQKVFKIELENNNIIAASEDCIGSFLNTTLSLSDVNIFTTELYYDSLDTESNNLSRLDSVGEYMVDYNNGVIYVLVSSGQDFNLGSVSYKRGYIEPKFPHITSVEDIYYRLNTLSSKEKHFEYIEFDDGFVLPKQFDQADEQYLSTDSSAVYVVSNNKIGAFVDSVFTHSITNNIQFLRGVYERNDLLNNPSPINFAEVATFIDKSITVGSLERKEYHSVEFDGSNYFITLNTGLLYESADITKTFSVIRILDNQELWDISGVVVLGNYIKLVLSGVGLPQINDSVLVTYTYAINDLSRVSVDYSKGEYYMDYTALTDEIIVSYEYGDNSLDFRESSALNTGETYYATYKAGALRDGLLSNFGSLIDISLLNTLDIGLSRERYRDALMAAMHSFSKGPTVEAIKSIAETISHLPAEVNESIFESWSLGYSLLNPRKFDVNGDFETVSSKYGDGLLINQQGQTLTLPIVSNLRLEEGTFETWIRPNWNGLDNLAELEFTILKDGYKASELDVFIGALEYHPTYEVSDKTGKEVFKFDKNKNVEGTPNKNKDGIYIYYAKDISETFDRWFVEVIDGYANDGYSPDGYINKQYSISINTNGKFYDVKSTIIPTPTDSKITTGTNNINFAVSSVYPNQGITFVADIPHYILDFAEEENKNRFSIFKDESGYLNFKVFDRFKNSYTVSTDVSYWKSGDLHHVATSWKLNTTMGRDELHLFIDGFEVPNIIRYGDRIKPYLHEKFRTVNPEDIVGLINANIVSSNDLSVILNSNQVVSSLNFSQYNINIGDTIYIEEDGFLISGYLITDVNGNTLTLDTLMPQTLTDGSFTINKVSFPVSTEIDIFPNFNVSLVHSYLDGYDLSINLGSPDVVSALVDFESQGVVVGDLFRIDGYQYENFYTVIDVNGNTLTLNDNMPATLSSLIFNVYHNEEEEIPGLKANSPAYELSKSTDGYYSNILTIKNKALTNDIVLIRTLGINHRKIKRKYYVWGNNSNILKTLLPSPISLDEVMFRKIILPMTPVGPNNSTLNLGVFNSDNLLTAQPTNNLGGRTLSIFVQGDNIDFTTPVSVNINGMAVDGYGIPYLTTESILFDEIAVKDTSNLFATINYIQIDCKPINSSISSALVEVREKYSLTKAENIDFLIATPDVLPSAIVKYSYQVSFGNKLYSDGYIISDGYTVTDDSNFFSSNLVDNYLVITNPVAAAGYYKISSVSDDHHSMTLTAAAGSLPFSQFSDGYYQVLNVIDHRSGLQNGYFTFEYNDLPGEPYYLTEGLYELEYYTYLGIPFDLSTNNMFIGSDFTSKNHLHGTIDEMQLLNIALTDTRIGETAPSTQRTITKDFNSIKASKPDENTLVLTHFDTFPPVNEANVYIFADKNIIQAGNVINDNFKQSIRLIDNPLIIDNDGILDTKKQGTIEFWVNPLFDTNNDPNYRFYFDAFGDVSEQLTSDNNTTISLKGKASQILGVFLQSDTEQKVNYFAGGEISGDGGQVFLHKQLPKQNADIVVNYIPKGLVGDRISIYKDPFGYLNFNIRGNNTDYKVRAPIFWARNSWHRVKATYKVNSGLLLDEIHMFIDGYERGNVVFGSDLLFGQGLVYGSSYYGPNTIKHTIKFTDSINKLYIGSDSNRGNSAHCLIDNLRISNIARPLYKPFNEPIDPNYSSNLNTVYPITEDLYTTLLVNFDSLLVKNIDFTLLNNRNTGLADFSINILDSFGIINDNSKVKEILEELIRSFKPANTKAFITYV